MHQTQQNARRFKKRKRAATRAMYAARKRYAAQEFSALQWKKRVIDMLHGGELDEQVVSSHVIRLVNQSQQWKQATVRAQEIQKQSRVHHSVFVTDDGQPTVPPAVRNDAYALRLGLMSKTLGMPLIKVGDTKRSAEVRFNEWKFHESTYYQDASLMGSFELVFELHGEMVYIRDYELHKKLQERGYLKVHKMQSVTQIIRDTISHEVFAPSTAQCAPITMELLQELFDEIVEDVRTNPDSTVKVYRHVDDGRNSVVRHYAPTQNFALRDYQQAFVDKAHQYFTEQYQRDTGAPINFLLSAPTRSGKSHMVMSAVDDILRTVKGTERGLVVVLSGIADIIMEWQATVEQHEQFNHRDTPGKGPTRIAFVHRDTLLQNPRAVEQEYEQGADIVVVALTMQDLYQTADNRKNDMFSAHDFLKLDDPENTPLDMLIIDEAHYAAFTNHGAFKSMLPDLKSHHEYEKLLRESEQVQKDWSQGAKTEKDLNRKITRAAQVESKKIEQTTDTLKQLNPSIGTFYVSATPYNELAGGTTFKQSKGNVEIITKKQILDAALQWTVDNPDAPEEESPFYAMVSTSFYGIDPGADIEELFAVQNSKFVHEENTKALIYNFAGFPYRGRFRFARVLDDAVYRDAGLGNHVLITVPSIAAADAVEKVFAEIAQHHAEFQHEIINISSSDHASLGRIAKAPDIKSLINTYDRQGKKTITITVDRMLTGVTVKQWDTIVFWRNMQSAQQFEQAAGRVGSSHVVVAENNDGEQITFVQKPNAAVLSYAPNQVVTVVHEMAKFMGGVMHNTAMQQRNARTAEGTSIPADAPEHKTVDEHMKDALQVTKLFTLPHNGHTMFEMSARDILDVSLAANAGHGLMKYARSVRWDSGAIFKSQRLLNALLAVKSLDTTIMTKTRQFESEDKPEGRCQMLQCKRKSVASAKPQFHNMYCRKHLLTVLALHKRSGAQDAPDDGVVGEHVDPVASKKEKTEIDKLIAEHDDRVAHVMNRFMFYVALSGTEHYEFTPLLDELNTMLAKDPAELTAAERRRIELVQNIDLSVDVLNMLMEDNVLDYSMDTQLHHVQGVFHKVQPGDPQEVIDHAVNTLFKDFSRFSPNEVMTPAHVAEQLWDALNLSAADYARFAEDGISVLDPGANTASLVQHFLSLAKQHDVPKDKIRFMVIPTSPLAYEVMYKMYTLYGLNTDDILYIDGVETLDMLRLVKAEITDTKQEARRVVRSVFDKIRNRQKRSAAKRSWRTMKERVERFEYVVSNPPYQDEKNRPIFQHFQDMALEIADHTSMIYMASRWWYGTSGLQDFRDRLLSNPKLQSVTYFNEIESSKLIFDGTGIAGGVNIVTLRTPENTDSDTNAEDTEFTLTEHATGESVTLPHGTLRLLPQRASLVHIAQKIQQGLDKHGLDTLLDRDEHVINEVGLTGKQLKELSPLTATADSAVPEGQIKVYANATGSKGGLSAYYTIQTPPGYVPNERYKVCIGQSIVENENRSLRLLRFGPETTFGRSTISLAFFDMQEEADNFATYVSSRFFEFALRLSLSGRMKTFGAFVPDFADYTSTNTVLDWSKPLDPQLYTLFNLSQDEIALIEQSETFN